jgi:hypothetical protein
MSAAPQGSMARGAAVSAQDNAKILAAPAHSYRTAVAARENRPQFPCYRLQPP